MSKIVILKSRTYIPKLFNLGYIVLLINHIHIKYANNKISIFEAYNPENDFVQISDLNLPNLPSQTNLFLKFISLQAFTIEFILRSIKTTHRST